MRAPRHYRLRAVLFGLALIALLLLAVACGGGGNQGPEVGDRAGRDQGQGTQVAAGDPDSGRRLYATTCTACHGQNGEGVPGLGKDLTNSKFVQDSTDSEMVEFLRVGRRANHPENTTGVDMPPRGGNPSLTDKDLADITAYLRQLQD